MKNNRIFTGFIAFIIAILSQNVILGQEIIWGNTVGLFGGGNLNFHSVSMNPLFQNARNPVEFSNNVNSFSGFFGLEGNFQISTITVITARIGYDFAGVDFLQKPTNYTTNSLKTQLNYLDLTPMVKFVNIIPNFNSLYFTTGINFGIPIAKTFNFQQQIGTSRTQTGEIPDSKMRISLPLGLGYIYKITGDFAVIPEVSYNIQFTEVSSNSNWQKWSFPQLKFGLSLTYMLPKSKKEKPKIDTVSQILDVKMKEINFYDNSGEKKKLNVIQLEEAEYGEYFPLVPYVFFDVNETEIDAKYIKQEENISTETGLYSSDYDELEPNLNALDISYQIIDIIGERMTKNSHANLTVTGTIDGKIENSKEISEYRALTVKKYILSKYDEIDSNRIEVKHGNLPAKPSAQTVKDGIVENRRVEFSSANSELFEPIFVKGEKRRISTPDMIEFVPEIEIDSANSVTSWDLEILQSDRIVRKLSGENLLEKIVWNIGINELYPSQLPIEYKLSVYQKNGAVATVNGNIPMDFLSSERKKTIEQPDKIISKYSLILFDFNSPTVTQENKNIIDKYIIPNIKYGSKVDIYGFTDKIGVPEYNEKLSTARANAVRDYILTKNRNVPISAIGLGSNSEIFDNNLPTGRQLSRTVQILVVTPK